PVRRPPTSSLFPYTTLFRSKQVRFISAQQSNDINYRMYGIRNAILIDNTGKFRDYLGLSNHLENDAISKIIVTAPGKDIPNVVLDRKSTRLNSSHVKISYAV